MHIVRMNMNTTIAELPFDAVPSRAMPKPGSTYDVILAVVKRAARSGLVRLAAHEFTKVCMRTIDCPLSAPLPCADCQDNGRWFVGCSESTIGRRMREMAEPKRGWLTVRKREGKNFVEYESAV